MSKIQTNILTHLRQSKKSLTVKQISMDLSCDENPVRYHLTMLRGAGVVLCSQVEGARKALHYVIAPDYQGDMAITIKKPSLARPDGFYAVKPARFVTQSPMSGVIAQSCFSQIGGEALQSYKPKYPLGFVPSGRRFITSGQGKPLDNSK
jgi:hypothetical protein